MSDAKPKTIPGLRIRSIPESFWRAGRKWTRESQDVPASEFTRPQIQALQKEPNLVVVQVEIPVEPDSASGEGSQA